jgi:hypothetical protein
MAAPGFYNDNTYRAYPFLEEAETVEISSSSVSVSSATLGAFPESAIVDFGTVMGIEAGFLEHIHKVYLAEVRRTGTTIEFEFRTDAPGASAYPVVFTRDITDPEYSIEDVVSPTELPSSSISSGACPDNFIWDAYLVTGPLEDLIAVLPSGSSFTFTEGQWQIEHSRIQSLLQAFVSSLNLANYDRTHADPPPQCSESSSLGQLRRLFVNATCIQGNPRLVEGYNCTLTQEEINNTIVVGAAVGSGAGEACEEVPLYEGESPPAGSTLLTGGPNCGEIVKTINGVGGQTVQLMSGPGVRVNASPDDPNELIVDVDLHDFATCLQSSISEGSE